MNGFYLPDEGSTANTATLKSFWVKNWPNASIKVDFPAPGGPDRPILKELQKQTLIMSTLKV